METRSNHVLVGAVILALLVAVVGFVIWLSQVSGEDRKEYDIFFQQAVDGLADGAAVTFSGVPVGQVEEIALEPRTPEFVRVRISIREDTPILQGTTATLQSVGFTGVSQIQLDGGQRGAPPITEPGPYDVPVIPARRGGIGAILNSAPELLQRVQTLTERLSELLGERNQQSIAGILDNTEIMSRELAARSPEIAATLAEARIAIRQTGLAITEVGELADATERVVQSDTRPLINDLRHTVRAAERTVSRAEGTLAAAERSMVTLDETIGEARPGIQALTKQTIPEVGLLVRDLRESAENLAEVTDRLERQGIGGIIGGEKLPDYRPERRRRR